MEDLGQSIVGKIVDTGAQNVVETVTKTATIGSQIAKAFKTAKPFLAGVIGATFMTRSYYRKRYSKQRMREQMMLFMLKNVNFNFGEDMIKFNLCGIVNLDIDINDIKNRIIGTKINKDVFADIDDGDIDIGS